MKRPDKPGSQRWGRRLVAGAAELGVPVTAAQADTLARHAAELVKWNRKINLTRISDPAEMASKHYVDSLACIPYIPAGANVLDIGSGGGFPGLPLAVVAQPRLVLMIDSVGKKISFLQHAIRLLELDNARARHIRAQELQGQADYRGFFDRVVCRALADIGQIIDLAFPLLKPGGVVVALKGRIDRVAREHSRLMTAGQMLPEPADMQIATYRLPVLNEERSLVLLTK